MAHSPLPNLGDSWSPRWRSLHPVLTDGEILDALRDFLHQKLAADLQHYRIVSLQIVKQTAPCFRLPNGRLCHWAQSTKTASLSIEAAICKHMPHLWRGPYKRYPLVDGQEPAAARDIYTNPPLFPDTLRVPGAARGGKARQYRIKLTRPSTDPAWALLCYNSGNPGMKPHGIHALYIEEFRPRPSAALRFCVVREPMERFVSAFHYMQHSLPQIFGPQKSVHRPETLADFVAQADALLRRAQANEKFDLNETHVLEHALPQVFFIGREPSYYTHIFRMGEWERLEACLSEWVGTSVKLPHINASRGKEAISLTPALQRRVEAFYAEDYKFWGRYF